MEDIYTIKVKTKPDTRNLYPSERRYSASTVNGLAWVHLALAATSFLFACLALINPTGGGTFRYLDYKDADKKNVTQSEFFNNITLESPEVIFNATTERNQFPTSTASEYSWILVIAPSLLTITALAAGIASIMASIRWYIDQNITWLFIMSVLSTIIAVIAFGMILTWIIWTSEGIDKVSEFYKDKVPFSDDYIIVKKSDIVHNNGSHLIISQKNSTTVVEQDETQHLLTKRVLSINILIAAFLEFLWSLLSMKIAYKGMKNTYKDDNFERPGNQVIVTTIKGNPNKIPRFQSKPDIIAHYPMNSKIKRLFLTQGQEGFYLKNQNAKKVGTETTSEYRDRMLNFINKCQSYDGQSHTEIQTPSIQSENVLNRIPEATAVEINLEENSEHINRIIPKEDRCSVLSWGDQKDHEIYNQNNLDLDKILKYDKIETDKLEIDNSSEIDVVKSKEHIYEKVK